MGEGRIHYENPFVDPPEARSPARRFRGRLVAPVTIWTAGLPTGRAGLTVSSVMVAEGRPALVLGLINDTTELFEAVMTTERFVVHVLERADRPLAERFAGLKPSPGGPFVGLELEDDPYGPVLAGLATRARCRMVGATETGYHRLVTGAIEHLDVDSLMHPLAHFRGRYRGLDER